jgi:hypothetical protein
VASRSNGDRYVQRLFECFVRARQTESDNPFGASGVLESALATIGGPAVVAGYDEIIVSRPFQGAQFMRLHTESGSLRLSSRGPGEERAGELAQLLGLPLFQREPADD